MSAGLLVPELCKVGVSAAVDKRGTYVMQCVLDGAVNPNEALQYADALLRVSQSETEPTLFNSISGLTVLAKLVEHLVSSDPINQPMLHAC